jgi:hypothetical protein
VGTWQKTQDVYFSSEIWGNSYMLVHAKVGGRDGDGYNYHYYYNDQGLKRYGDSQYDYYDSSAGRYKKVITRFDVQGPPSGEYPHRDVWVQNYGPDGEANTEDDAWTFQTKVYKNEDGSADYETYYADMALLENDPKTGSRITPTEQLNFHDSGFSGIMAGLGNLWTNMGTATPTLGNPYTSAPTSLYMLGDSDKFDQQAFNLFAGRVVSFNPLVTMDPFANSKTPVWNDKHGAYYGFLGGIVDDANNISGFFRALYMDQNNNIGLIYSDSPLTGEVDPNVGMWKAQGDIYTYQMLGSVESGYTPENFAQSIGSWDDRGSGPALEAEHVVGVGGATSSIDMQTYVSSTLSLNNILVEGSGSLSIGQVVSGGAYSGAPESWSWTFDPPVEGYLPEETRYMNVAITATDNTFAGKTAGAEIDWTYAETKITGGRIKGLFDPATSTWKALTMETRMRTENFMQMVQGMSEAERLAFQKATNIPAFKVGQVDLSGNRSFDAGGSMSVMLKDMTFFAPSTGGDATIWASAPNAGNPTAGVSGSYTGAPNSGWTVPLSGTSATVSINSSSFEVKRWDTGPGPALPQWGATVNGAGTVNSQPIGFTGGAAGAINAGNSSFSGTAAGIVTPPPVGD